MSLVLSSYAPVMRPPLLTLIATVLVASGTSKVVIVPSDALMKPWELQVLSCSLPTITPLRLMPPAVVPHAAPWTSIVVNVPSGVRRNPFWFPLLSSYQPVIHFEALIPIGTV